MKKRISIHYLFLPLILLVCLPQTIWSQNLFNSFINPGFSGQTEYTEWDVFYNAYNGINYPDYAAPNGVSGTASSAGFTPPSGSGPADPIAFWHTSNATLTQTGTSSAFVISPGITGNIYSFAAPTSYVLADQTPFTANTVVLQFQTDGSLMDYSSIKLLYGAGYTSELSATNILKEYKASGSTFGGITNRSALQWDLTGLGITDYKIVFSSASSSNSLQNLILDTAATYSEAVASARTWDAGAGTANWSNAVNWSNNTQTSSGGNVVFNSGTNVIVDGTDRTVGEIFLSAPGSFSIGSSGGAKLLVNTGITVNPASPGSYTVSAPIVLGGYDFLTVGTGSTLNLNGVISGSGSGKGIYKLGEGTLNLSGNNTFEGSVTIGGGTTVISGNNSYTGSTTIGSGRVLLKNNALNGVAGALGNATSTIALGSAGSTGLNASLLADGDYTVSRDISVTGGNDDKMIGAQNTGTGALFSGNVTLETGSNNVKLHAENSGDKVTFSGNISGGVAANALIKTGLGTVVLSGSAKTYDNATLVGAGTLIISSGAAVTGNGNWSVQSGATLNVNGTLSGSGTFTLNGQLTGSGALNRNVVTSSTSVIAPGNSAGTLTLSSLDASAGSTFNLELGTSSDQIAIAGLFTGSSAASGLKFNITGLSGFNAGQVYTLMTFGSVTGLDAADLQLLTGGLVLDSGFGTNGWLINGNSLQVQFSAVPEPSTYVMLGLGLLFLVAFRRKSPPDFLRHW